MDSGYITPAPDSETCTALDVCEPGCHPVRETCGGDLVCPPDQVSHIDNCGGQTCGAPCDGGGGGGCTVTNPTTPVLVSPTDRATLVGVTQVTLDWNDLASWGEECGGPSTRVFEVCIGPDSSNPCTGDTITVTPVSGDTPLSTTTYTVSDQQTTYFWKVKAYNKASYGSPWSPTFSFTSSLCGVPTLPTPFLLSPTDGQIFDQVTQVNLSWNPVTWNESCGGTNNRSYTLCVGTDEGDPCAGDSFLLSHPTDPPETQTYSQSNPGSYFWKVMATNKDSISTVWSDTWQFDITNDRPSLPSAPNYVTPLEIPNTGAVTLSTSPTDADGGSNIESVYLALNNCLVNPGLAGWSNFEHNNANYIGAYGYNFPGGPFAMANNNSNAACTGTVPLPPSPWGTPLPKTNAQNNATLSSISLSPVGNNLNSVFQLSLNNYQPTGLQYAYMMVRDKQMLWDREDGPAWTRLNQICVEGFNSTNPSYITNWSTWGTCSFSNHQRIRTRTCTEDCLQVTNNCDTYLGEGGSGDCGSECTYNPATNVQTQTQDCTATVTGKLYDATDVSSCPELTDLLALNGQGNAITFDAPPWQPITSPVTVGADGSFGFTAYAPGNYTPNFQSLVDADIIGNPEPKLSCVGRSITFGNNFPACDTQPCENLTGQNYGFWRAYGGWWQAVGGPGYAALSSGDSVKSIIPSSLPAPEDMRLIKTGATDNKGLLFYGSNYVLGPNPDARVNVNNTSYQGTYSGNITYNYAFFNAKYSLQNSDAVWVSSDLPNWDNDPDGNGYMFLKYTGTLPLSIGTKNITAGQKFIALVPGNVNITGDITVASGGFLTLISSGNITFNQSVARADGWFSADGQIIIASTGNQDTEVQFLGNGSFVGHAGFSLIRDLGLDNNTTPAELFTYSVPQLIAAPDIIKFPYKKYTPYYP